MISVIINTCAGTTNEEILKRRGSRDNTSKKPYAERASKLREMLARYYDLANSKMHDIEIIVVGEWEPGSGYLYVHDPGKLMDPSDQAQQRHTGTQHANGDVMVYLNDDHYIPMRDFPSIPWVAERHGMVGPAFYLLKDGVETSLDTYGLNQSKPYIPGHAMIATREMMEKAPWSIAAGHIGCTDVEYCDGVRERGLAFEWRTELVRCYDIEAGDFPDE